MEPNFQTVQRGRGYMYISGDFLYKQYKRKAGTIYLKCCEDYCQGAAKVQDNELTITREHCDHDCKEEIARSLFRQECRKRASGSDVRLREIYDEVSTELGSGTGVTFSDIESSMYKRRRGSRPALPRCALETPLSLAEAGLDRFADSTPFYRQDVSCLDGDGYAVIFASDAQLQLLAGEQCIYMDRTFKIVPTHFNQLFTIFVDKAGNILPVVFVLMTHDSEALYMSVFERISSLVPNFKPRSVISDFESVPAAAMKQFAPSVTANACWFHFSQAIVRKINELGILSFYLSDHVIKSTIKKMLCLPLLPPDEIQVGYEYIKAVHVGGDLTALYEYFESFWLQHIGPEKLSVHGDEERTNSAVEGFHSRILRRLGVCPNLYTFVKKLMESAKQSEDEYARLSCGLEITKSRKKQLYSDRRLRQCERSFSDGSYTVPQFLEAAKLNIGKFVDERVAIQTAEDCSPVTVEISEAYENKPEIPIKLEPPELD